jgi:hypothetical protein
MINCQYDDLTDDECSDLLEFQIRFIEQNCHQDRRVPKNGQRR